MQNSLLTRLDPGVARTSHWLPGYLALAVIWGSSFLFIKIGVRELHPLYLTLFRVGAGAAALLAVLAWRRTRLPRDPRVWGHLAVVALIGVALPFTLFGYGEQHISSVLAGIWNATTPLVALPVAVLVFGTERMTLPRVVGLVLGFAGVLVILGVWRASDQADLTGQLMCFAAAVCYAFSIPYQRRFLAGRAESGIALPAGQLIVATLLLAVAAPVVAGAPVPPTRLSADVIASVLALGVLGTGLAFLLNFRVIRLAGASTSASVTYLIPVLATVIGIAALDEAFAWHQPVGAAIVLAGVAVAQGGWVRMAGWFGYDRAAAAQLSGREPRRAVDQPARC